MSAMKWLGWALGGTALALAPLLLGSYPLYVVSSWLIMALAALGLNIPVGLGSIYSFGHGGFMLIGAYATSAGMLNWGAPLPLALLFAVLLAAITGAVIGLPALRMSGFSLAIVTFSFGFMLFNLVKSIDGLGGPQGLTMPDTSLGGSATYYLIAGCFAAGCLGFVSLATGKTGRALRTLGESAIVARSLGISLTRYKIIAFVLSAIYAALAGGLLALLTGFVAPDTFTPELSINLFAVIVIGGIGTFAGPLLGALFFVLIPELTQSAQNLGEVIYALLFCLAVTVSPGGIFGMARSILARGSMPVPVEH